MTELSEQELGADDGLTAYEDCLGCRGYTVVMSVDGDVYWCNECNGSGKVRAMDDHGRFARVAAPKASAVTASRPGNENLMGLDLDLHARADLFAGALCAEPRPRNAAQRRTWLTTLNRPFRTDPASVAEMKQLCLRCPLTTTCRAAGVGAEYGVWAAELHEPADECAEASA